MKDGMDRVWRQIEKLWWFMMLVFLLWGLTFSLVVIELDALRLRLWKLEHPEQTVPEPEIQAAQEAP